MDGTFSTCHMPLGGVLQLREFSKGVPTRELGFGCELAHTPVNRPFGELVPKELAFFTRKLAILATFATLLNGSERHRR